MKDSSVPVAVLSTRREDAEFLNKTMRDAGYAVHCERHEQLDDLRSSLARAAPHLLVFFADSHEASVEDVAEIRRRHASISPLVVVRGATDERAIGDAQKAGAQDLVAASNPERLCIVCERELKTYRLESALRRTLDSATQYKDQLKCFMSDSTDAIAQVQEGIIVEANQAWADLFARSDGDNILAPLMDLFTAESQTTLKGALIALARDQWADEALEVDAISGDGQVFAVRLGLHSSIFEGEPATRLSIRHGQPADRDTDEIAEQALATDPTTGYLLRHQFLDVLAKRLTHPAGNGASARALALVRPDRFVDIQDQVGPLLSEEILAQLAGTFGKLLAERDLAGRIGGTVLGFVLERDTLQDIRTWAEHAVDRVANELFEVGGSSASLHCSIGLAEIGEESDGVDGLLRRAEKSIRRARGGGGNRACLEETSDESTRIKRVDALWVRQIRSALVENRFRLVHLNISSLAGNSERMFDTVIRMIDEQGDEIAPADFMGTASRNKLMRAIDRWVINATVAYCQREASDLVFIKLSAESIRDASVFDWLLGQLKRSGVSPHQICLQVTERDVSLHQRQATALAKRLRSIGCRFAVENFGIGRDPMHVLAHTPMDYLKFDGSLIQRVAEDFSLQDKLRAFISNADRNGIKTVATHVENATTMAVLFQLGVGYMQGHYLHEPEVVLEEAV